MQFWGQSSVEIDCWYGGMIVWLESGVKGLLIYWQKDASYRDTHTHVICHQVGLISAAADSDKVR